MMLPAICEGEGKVPFTRRLAKMRLDGHPKHLCPRCRSGRYVWNRYRCPEPGADHWHCGHKPRVGRA